MDDLQQVLAALDELESIVNRYDHPEPNSKALSAIRSITSRITGYDGYISEKASRISQLAGIFYSERKHSAHPGGPSVLLTEIGYDLPNRIRSQVDYLRRLQKDRSKVNDAD